MAKTRLFTFIFKVRCESCTKRPDPRCNNCRFIKWRNINKIVKSADAVNRLYPNWIFINVYPKVPGGGKGPLLETYTNGKTVKMPMDNNELGPRV